MVGLGHPADTILPGERAAHPAPTLVMKVRGAKGSYVEHGRALPGNYCNTSPTSGMFEDDDFSELTQGGICFPFLEGKLHSGSTDLLGIFGGFIHFASGVPVKSQLGMSPLSSTWLGGNCNVQS